MEVKFVRAQNTSQNLGQLQTQNMMRQSLNRDKNGHTIYSEVDDLRQ